MLSRPAAMPFCPHIAMTEASRPHGRPSLYTEEIAAEVCARLADGEGLRAICAPDGMPAPSTIIGWVIDDREGFSERYAKAKDVAMHVMAEDIVEIADDVSNDTKIVGEGQEIPNSEWISRSRLRVDTRKWLLSKLMAKKYGDKLDMNLGGQADNPVRVVTYGWRKKK